MAVLGNSFDETLGLATAGTELMVGQSGKVARGLRTIGIRIADLAKDVGILQYQVNGTTKTISLLNESTGDLKSTFAVFEEINKNWKEMSKSEQQALAVALAGATQFEVYTAVQSNFATAVEAANASMKSQGSAMTENERYMASFEAKISNIQGSLQQWAIDGSGTVAMLLSMVDAFLKINTQVDILTPALTTLAVSTIPILTAAVEQLGAKLAIGTAGATLLIGAIVFALANVPKVIDGMTTSVEEQKAKVEELREAYADVQTQIENIGKKKTKTDGDIERLKVLEAQERSLAKQVKLNEQLAVRKEVFGEGVWGKGKYGEAESLREQIEYTIEMTGRTKAAIKDLEEVYGDAANGMVLYDAYQQSLVVAQETTTQSFSDLLSVLDDLEQFYPHLSDAEKEQIDVIKEQYKQNLALAESQGLLFDEVVETTTATEQAIRSLEEYTTLITELNKDLSNLKNAYSAISEAQMQFEESGFITLGTYSELMDLGNNYIDLLFDEEGNLLSVADAMYKVTAARIDELAVTKARSLIDNVKQNGAEWNSLKALTEQYNNASISLWDLVGGETALMEVQGLNTDRIKAQVNAIQAWAEQAKQGIKTGAGYATSQQGLKAQTDRTTDAFKRQEDALKKQEEALKRQQKALDDQKDKYERAFNYLKQRASDYADSQIEALKKQQDQESEYYDNKIDAIKKQNDLIEEQMQLQKLQSDLEVAKSKKVAYYREGKGVVYEQDIGVISSAQAALDAFNREKQTQDEIARLEAAKKATLDNLSAQIKAWEDYKTKWGQLADGYEEEQDRLLAEQLFGIKIEKDNFDIRLENLRSFVEEYQQTLARLEMIKGQIDEVQNKQSNLKDNKDKATSSGGGGTGGKVPSKPSAPNSSGGVSAFEKEQVNKRRTELNRQIASAQKEYNLIKVESPASAKAILDWITQLKAQLATLPKYARGATNIATGHIGVVNDGGDELIVPPSMNNGNAQYLQKGTGIVPKSMTENLMEIGKYNLPQLSKMLNGKSTGDTIIQVDKMEFPNMTDKSGVMEFIDELKHFKLDAIQQSSGRA